MHDLKLTVVGAGPGDPELITLKGIRALESADVVLYDALANDQLIDYAKNAKKIVFVGKRAGLHKYSQEEINELIVRYAHEYGHVVRLKGGDPYIFGRGQEEMIYAHKYGLETAYVPGISSVTGASGTAGIPLTSRGFSESFWVITGTTKYGDISNDIKLAAQSSATVVILMGMKHLEQIMASFMENGQSHTPVAIIQNGTLQAEKQIIGSVESIAETAREEKIGAPALIIVGNVVHALEELRERSPVPVLKQANSILDKQAVI